MDEARIKIAIGFLLSPDIETASEEKRMSFLRSKGLSDVEIEEAKDRVSIPPMIPERSVHHKKSSVTKNLLIFVITTFASSAYIYSHIKEDWIIRLYSPFLKNTQVQVADRLKSIAGYLKKLVKYSALHKPVLECDDKEDCLVKSLKEMVYTSNKNLAKVISRLQDIKEVTAKDNVDLITLSEDCKVLSKHVRENLYYPGGFNLYQPKEATDCKSQIRSLKGILLSRPNFSTAKSTPPLG